tara:strand:+ start:4569 stop:5966 length:1398 start_codon:yes stop_codon:yes gene_type:complete
MDDVKRVKIKQLLVGEGALGDIRVDGWVRTRRDSKGGFSFIEVNDGSCLKNIQIILDHSLIDSELLCQITTGSCISVMGKIVVSPAKGQTYEIQAIKTKLHGTADAERYPLQKKRHSFEFLREIAHLRPRTNTMGAVMRIRNRLAYGVHNFFQNRGFIYLHTPIITTSDCEGAGDMFQVTTLDMLKPSVIEGKVDYTKDFFGQEARLTVSGQLEAEIFAMAFSDVYTFGPTFRAENSNTSRHLAEFWMIEPEMAFYDLDDNIGLAESFIKYLLKEVLENCAEDMIFLNQWIDKTLIDRLSDVVKNNFEKINYDDAIHILKKSNAKFDYPVEWGFNLQAEHERYLTEKEFKKPVVVYDYPSKIKPFYMKVNEGEKTVRAMDILVPRLGEIIGGSQREDDHEILSKRIERQGLDKKDYWWYLDLRLFGTAPHSGFGLGFERLVQFTTGMENIRDVIPFPRTPKQSGF